MSNKKREPIDPIAIELSELFVNVLCRYLTNTAFCIDLARTCLGWELAGKPEKAKKAILKALKSRS